MHARSSARLEDGRGEEVLHTRLRTDPDVGVTVSPLLTPEKLRDILRVKDVRRINFESLNWLEEDCLKLVPKMCKGTLESLVLDRCSGVTDALMTEIGFNSPNLQELSIRNCPKVTVLGLNAVLRNCSQLWSLDISWNRNIFSIPEACADDDLIELYHMSVPKALQPKTAIRTTRETRDIVAELKIALEEFASHIIRLDVKVLLMEGVDGVNTELLRLIFSESVPNVSFPEYGDGKIFSESGEEEEEEEEEEEVENTEDSEDHELEGKEIESVPVPLEDGSEEKSNIDRRRSSLDSVVSKTSSGRSIEEDLSIFAPRVRKRFDHNLRVESTNSLAESETKNEQTESEEVAPQCEQISSVEPNIPTKALQLLSFLGCQKVTMRTAIYISHQCHNLRSLNLSMANKLGSKTLTAFSENCSRLEEVNVSGLTRLGNIGVTNLCTLHGGSLKRLSLAGCVLVSRTGIQAIASLCTALEELNLTGCTRIPTKYFMELIEGPCSNLRKLNLTSCYQIDPTTFDDLLAVANDNRPDLQIIRRRAKPVGDPVSSGLVPNWRPLPASQQLRAIAKDGQSKRGKSAPKKKK